MISTIIQVHFIQEMNNCDRLYRFYIFSQLKSRADPSQTNMRNLEAQDGRLVQV